MVGAFVKSIARANTGFLALEGFSESLAGELDPAWNIQVS